MEPVPAHSAIKNNYFLQCADACISKYQCINIRALTAKNESHPVHFNRSTYYGYYELQSEEYKLLSAMFHSLELRIYESPGYPVRPRALWQVFQCQRSGAIAMPLTATPRLMATGLLVVLQMVGQGSPSPRQTRLAKNIPEK